MTPSLSTAITLRRALEDAIERLVAVLDDLDGDADLEPSLAGWQGVSDDREDDPAEGPEDCDWVPAA